MIRYTGYKIIQNSCTALSLTHTHTPNNALAEKIYDDGQKSSTTIAQSVSVREV